MKKIIAIVQEENSQHRIYVQGRFAQTLEALVNSGAKGITALDLSNWAVRLSHYIHILRRKYGLNIETVEERHGGEFPGKHGRYFLRSHVVIVDRKREAA